MTVKGCDSEDSLTGRSARFGADQLPAHHTDVAATWQLDRPGLEVEGEDALVGDRDELGPGEDPQEARVASLVMNGFGNRGGA